MHTAEHAHRSHPPVAFTGLHAARGRPRDRPDAAYPLAAGGRAPLRGGLLARAPRRAQLHTWHQQAGLHPWWDAASCAPLHSRHASSHPTSPMAKPPLTLPRPCPHLLSPCLPRRPAGLARFAENRAASVAMCGHFRAHDVALSLLRMVSNNIGHISTMSAQQHGMKHIVFGGSFIRDHPCAPDTACSRRHAATPRHTGRHARS